MPKFVMKSSATIGPMAKGTMPSMSRGEIPASLVAATAASS
jgi:hypothetical protein